MFFIVTFIMYLMGSFYGLALIGLWILFSICNDQTQDL
jgi:hypothetical protein